MISNYNHYCQNYYGFNNNPSQKLFSLLILFTSHRRRKVVDLHAALAGELPHVHLEEVDRPAHKEQYDDVWNEEGSSAVGISRVGEPPDVAEAYGHGYAGHQELQATAPLVALRALFFQAFGVVCLLGFFNLVKMIHFF